MIEFTVSGQKKVSNPHGVVEIKLFTAKVLFPHDYNGITMSEDDMVKRREALFYVRNFLLQDAMKEEMADPYFKGIRTAEITKVRELSVEEIEKAIEKGDLFDFDINDLKASDVDRFTSKQIYHAVIMMDGDNTAQVAPRIKRLLKDPIALKRKIVKEMLGLEDEVVEVLQEKKTTIKDKIKKKKATAKKDVSAAKEIK